MRCMMFIKHTEDYRKEDVPASATRRSRWRGASWSCI